MIELASLAEFCAYRGFPLDQDQLNAFATFRDALYTTNQVMNLTRIPFEECELKHFVDSLLFVDLIPKGARVLDIGTGPGFPAWPIACARPDTHVVALDSTQKMVRFLESQPLPNLECTVGRAEEWGVRDTFDVVTGRALAPLPLQLELSAAPCRIGGWVIAMRTAAEEDAILAYKGGGTGLVLETLHTREIPGTDIQRLFPIFQKRSGTDRKFPRSWAEMRRKPWL